MADIPEVESRWTDASFNQYFENLVKTEVTYVEAYRQAELKHLELFGKLRYASYDSFRNCRKKMLFGN